MDSLRRQRSNTDTGHDQHSNKEHHGSRGSFSKETKSNNRISLPPGSPPATGKPWMKLFNNQQLKKTLSEPSDNPFLLDITYVTPRLIVMTTLRENFSEESSHSIVESIQNLFDTKHPNNYMIYTLDQSANEQLSNQKELFHKRVVDLPLFDEYQTPRLVALLWFCQKITSYLLESPLNVAVLHCIDERNHLAFGACSLLAYHQIFSCIDQILPYYQSKRCANVLLTMSQKRYIQYLCDLSSDVIERPHFNQLIIKAIHLSPVPLVNRQKTGCRPFVDIYDQNQKKIFSTYQEIAKLKVYSAADSHCLIPINLPFNGDLTIHISHAAIGHSRQTLEGGIRICELTINSNFSQTNRSDLSYLRNELDGIDQNDKHPTLFRLTIQINNHSQEIFDKQDLFTEKLISTIKQPFILFGDEYELQKAINDNEKQLKQQNVKSDDSSLSSVIHRRKKSFKEESTSPSPTSPISPQTGSFFASNSIPSFANPRHTTLLRQHTETNQVLTEFSSLIEEKSNQDQRGVGNLLDLDENELNRESVFEGSFSSTDIQPRKFSSSFDSQANLLDDSDPLTSSINSASIIFPSPFVPTTIPEAEAEEKSSTSTIQTNSTTTNSSNYNVNVITNNSTFTQSKPNVVRSNSTTNPPEKPKIDIYQYFVGIGDLGKDHRTPSEPTTIGAARKAVLAKDIDPIVLKVREWTEGKKGNIRALLCSLLTVTWPECTWNGCQMNELVTDDQVKKVYRKAVLHIHPDKLRDNPNEELAKLIFMELNEAWAQFEKRN